MASIEERMTSRIVARGVKIAMMVVLAGALFGFVVMSLWNWLVPALFGWRPITFWQALGLILLSKLLFGGIRGGGGHGGHGRRWRRRMRERWESMSPEQREQMRERMHACWGGRFSAPAEPKTDKP